MHIGMLKMTEKVSGKLPIFQQNELKYFRFSIDQYFALEMEYSRFMIYKDAVRQIESLFKLTSQDNNRRLYENKNIIDRFILECINHGISPHILNYTNNSVTNSVANSVLYGMIDNVYTSESIDLPLLSHQLFFNPVLGDENKLKETVYFKKMISEYIEKKIKYVLEKVPNLLKILVHANQKFIRSINDLNLNKNKPGYFSDIACSILVTTSDNYLIKYRGYSRVVNFYRYIKLIKNYDRPFPYDILRMILRYAIFDMSNQQWSIGINLYDFISNEMEIGFEMFASPLNFNMNMFCSLFLDTDKTFGSIGSFYNLTVDKLLNMNMHGVFYNPPYLPILMENTTKMCLNILDKMSELSNDFTIVSFLPNWADASYIQDFLASKYLVYSKAIQKGEYVLHEKDKGKLIKGTFDLLFIVMNSRKMSWDMDRRNYFDTCCKNIVKMMKDETLGKNIEK
jgi:hypothetical protein